MIVTDGKASMTPGNNTGETFVDPAGKFRIAVPINVAARTTGTSDTKLNNTAMTIILNGSLAKKTGNLIFGIEELGNTGCTSSVTIEKL